MEKPIKKRTLRNKKARPKPHPKNRYMHGSKLSEYRFLKVLRGFADENTAAQTAAEVKLSEKRTHELFDALRGKLMYAVMLNPFDFGWAGYFLFDGRVISPRGHRIFDAVSKSDILKSALIRHAPRTGLSGDEPLPRFSEVLFEVTVRVFCTLSMRKDNETLYSGEAHDAFAKLQMVAIYIDQQKENPDDPELFAALTASFQAIMNDFPNLLAQEEFHALVKRYQPHNYPSEVFYNDLRHYLLSHPILK